MDHRFALFAPTVDSVQLVCSCLDEDLDCERDADGVWSVVADLSAGQHAYGFRLRSRSWFMQDETVTIPDPMARFIDLDSGDSAALVTDAPGTFEWQHDDADPTAWDALVLYECYPGDFAGDEERDGTLAETTERIRHLQELGINALLLLPLTAGPPAGGWGYAPIYFFALDPRYGSEDDLRSCVDACHGAGIAVLLDQVCNHAHADCPLAKIDHDFWFLHEPPDPDNAWGPQFDFWTAHDEVDAQPALRFTTQAVGHWTATYHLDGARFDATAQIGDPAVLDALAGAGRAAAGDRPWMAIAEQIPEDPALVADGGPMDACWRSSFCSRMRAILAGDYDGDDLLACLDCRADGYDRPDAVVNYLGSHDRGHLVRALRDEELSEAEAIHRARLGNIVLFCAIGLPQIWMGDEFGAALAEEDEGTRLDWSLLEDERRADLFRLVCGLSRLRAEQGALRTTNCAVLLRDDEQQLLVVHRWNEIGSQVVVALHAGPGTVQTDCPMPDAGRWYECVLQWDSHLEPEEGLALELGPWQGQVFVHAPE
ncbi:MAG: alpha-amylase family glycosyl hydrolase [Planctomycetota bacterium]